MSTHDSTPPPSGGRQETESPHVAHVKAHLKRLTGGLSALPGAETLYLGHEDQDHFWELLGFRVTGHPAVMLGAARFQRHDCPGVEHSRESLAAYLTAPPAPMGSPFGPARAGEISLYLPRWHERIPGFLERLRGGPDHAPVHLHPALIQVAFDFRMANPSGMETAKRRAGPMSPFLFRTTAGHVLRGDSHGPGPRGGFVAITGCEQLGSTGRRALGAVMLNSIFIALAVPLEDEKTRLAASNWTPFLPATASRRHLLV